MTESILNWDGYIGTNVPDYSWTYSASADTEPNQWAQIEFGSLTNVQRNEVIAIAIREAQGVLKEFFEEITDENLKVDVDALQEYIDSFMKKAT